MSNNYDYTLDNNIIAAIKNKPEAGSYVLYRRMDLYLTGASDHTQICRVLPAEYGERLWEARLHVLATSEVISKAPIEHMRRLNSADLMRDIDTAPLDLLDDGVQMTAAGAWLLGQRKTPTD
jgi:hypothetical protein